MDNIESIINQINEEPADTQTNESTPYNIKHKIWAVYVADNGSREECNIFYTSFIDAATKEDALIVAYYQSVIAYTREAFNIEDFNDWSESMDAFEISITGPVV